MTSCPRPLPSCALLQKCLRAVGQGKGAGPGGEGQQPRHSPLPCKPCLSGSIPPAHEGRAQADRPQCNTSQPLCPNPRSWPADLSRRRGRAPALSLPTAAQTNPSQSPPLSALPAGAALWSRRHRGAPVGAGGAAGTACSRGRACQARSRSERLHTALLLLVGASKKPVPLPCPSGSCSTRAGGSHPEQLLLPSVGSDELGGWVGALGGEQALSAPGCRVSPQGMPLAAAASPPACPAGPFGAVEDISVLAPTGALPEEEEGEEEVLPVRRGGSRASVATTGRPSAGLRGARLLQPSCFTATALFTLSRPTLPRLSSFFS